MEVDRVGDKKLLVARSYKKYRIMNEVLKNLWMHLTVDFITKLPLVVEKNVILVVCNRLSKIAHFVATMEETLVEGLARLFRDNV